MKKYTYRIGLVGLLILTLFILPIWHVQTVQIIGNTYYSEETLLDSISFKPGSHILSLNKEQLIEELQILTYIDSVDVAYQFPNHIKVSVQERRPIAYVKFLDTYLCVDELGYVIEQSTQKRLALPEIEGMRFESFVLGEQLKVENSEQMGIIRQIVLTLDKYEFTEKVDTIDVSNIQQIHLYVDKLNVIIGNIRDFDEKIRYLIEVHKQYVMGILDLSLIKEGQAILKPIN